MIACIFTLDYEIYGNGEGSLAELVYEPTRKLMEIFRNRDARFVTFVEAAEFDRIEAQRSDPAIDLVNRQISDLHKGGYEIGLHLHPQWCNARFESGKWQLDYSEYNLCVLPRERIEEIVEGALDYLRNILGADDFAPLSFRAGNWLFQPTTTAAAVLSGRGIKVDSSVFKGGIQHRHGLDYRPALKNGYYWRFSENVNVPDSRGSILELPIYTKMVPFWKMITGKRVGMQRKGYFAERNSLNKLNRIRDFLRFYYPLKFDFCRMTLVELTSMIDEVIREDRNTPDSFKPVMAIGHTKDLLDLDTVDSFLSYLKQKDIAVSTFRDVYQKCSES